MGSGEGWLMGWLRLMGRLMGRLIALMGRLKRRYRKCPAAKKESCEL